MCGVKLAALTLSVRTMGTTDIGAFIPAQTTPGQSIKNHLFRRTRAAHLIGVLNTQQKLTAMLLGKTVIEERYKCRPDMGIACRRRRYTCTNFHKFTLIFEVQYKHIHHCCKPRTCDMTSATQSSTQHSN